MGHKSNDLVKSQMKGHNRQALMRDLHSKESDLEEKKADIAEAIKEVRKRVKDELQVSMRSWNQARKDIKAEQDTQAEVDEEIREIRKHLGRPLQYDLFNEESEEQAGVEPIENAKKLANG